MYAIMARGSRAPGGVVRRAGMVGHGAVVRAPASTMAPMVSVQALPDLMVLRHGALPSVALMADHRRASAVPMVHHVPVMAVPMVVHHGPGMAVPMVQVHARASAGPMSGLVPSSTGPLIRVAVTAAAPAMREAAMAAVHEVVAITAADVAMAADRATGAAVIAERDIGAFTAGVD